MEFIEWLIGGGIIAALSLFFVYLRYIDGLKEQVAKDAEEKALLNSSLISLQTEMKRLSNSYDTGITDYYNLRTDIKVIEQALSNLITRYNRDHTSDDLEGIKSISNRYHKK